MRARPSPLAENDRELVDVAETAANDECIVDVVEPEVERSIDVIPEVTPASSVSGSPMLGSSERLTHTAAGHSSTTV